MTSFIPANDATGWGDTFRAGLLVGHDVNGHTVDALTVYNVEKYGAVGDGTTNDTTACQNALNAAVAAGGGIVFFPTDPQLPADGGLKETWRF